jgi:hypothetical protein
VLLKPFGFISYALSSPIQQYDDKRIMNFKRKRSWAIRITVWFTWADEVNRVVDGPTQDGVRHLHLSYRKKEQLILFIPSINSSSFCSTLFYALHLHPEVTEPCVILRTATAVSQTVIFLVTSPCFIYPPLL